MVRYHEAGRFCEKDADWDQESALFHLEHAADCGELEAIVGLGLMYSQLPHHILSEVTLEVTCSITSNGDLKGLCMVSFQQGKETKPCPLGAQFPPSCVTIILQYLASK